jgi:Cu-processing system permease protein
MNAILIIAGKEIRDGLRNRWVMAITALLALFALTLAFLGAAPTGAVRVGALTVTVVSLSSLSIFLLPLVALLLSFDAIVGEMAGGTLGLLLAYPVARWQVVIGKFLGHSAILALATTIGYGCAGAAIAASAGSNGGWGGFSLLIASSVLLGAAFIAIGYVISVTVGDRAAAAGFAIGVWLVFVLIYDMALLGALVADQGRLLSAQIVNWLLLFNPADAYRMLNLGATSGARMFSGMAGLASDLRYSPAVMAAALGLWTAVPLGIAIVLFQRRQI